MVHADAAFLEASTFPMLAEMAWVGCAALRRGCTNAGRCLTVHERLALIVQLCQLLDMLFRMSHPQQCWRTLGCGAWLRWTASSRREGRGWRPANGESRAVLCRSEFACSRALCTSFLCMPHVVRTDLCRLAPTCLPTLRLGMSGYRAPHACLARREGRGLSSDYGVPRLSSSARSALDSYRRHSILMRCLVRFYLVF